MILSSLYELHGELTKAGKVEKLGWTQERVQWAVNLDLTGEIIGIDTLETVGEASTAKKRSVLPVLMMPSKVKRSVNVSANFLCDTLAYILGFGANENNSRDIDCFEASRYLHLSLLEPIHSDFAIALKAFYEKWDPTTATNNSLVNEKKDDLLKGGNMIFQINGRYVTDDEVIRLAWDAHADKGDNDAKVGQCLVTGEYAPIARLHPSIKGVRGAQSAGASLVSYNAEAYESYGLVQGDNGPVSAKVATAYGAALNYLISNQSQLIGDTTVVYWSKSAKDAEVNFFARSFFGNGENSSVSTSDLTNYLLKLARGQSIEWNDDTISPHESFYILGLAPNASRLSIRFFLVNTFGVLAKNLIAHYDRLAIDKPKFVEKDSVSIWVLLNETVNQKARVKSPRPQLAGAFTSSVLQNHRYPETLYTEVQLRIRAESGQINWRRAALIKAFLLRNSSNEKIKEVVSTVKLNNETNYLPYVLGRSFAVLEMIQKSANPGIKATIKDRYFNSACGTPSSIFPILINLAQKHLRKLSAGSSIYYNKELTDLLGRIDAALPRHLNLQDQGVFQLGYYHQTQKFYSGKSANTDLEKLEQELQSENDSE